MEGITDGTVLYKAVWYNPRTKQYTTYKTVYMNGEIVSTEDVDPLPP